MDKKGKVLLLSGILVFSCGVLLIVFLYISSVVSSDLNEKRVELIHNLIPQPTLGIWMDENENMPVFHAFILEVFIRIILSLKDQSSCEVTAIERSSSVQLENLTDNKNHLTLL